MSPEQLNRISEAVIGAAYKVANALGRGFLENVYENALAHELQKQGRPVKQQDPLIVRYDGIIVGEFRVDLVVDGAVLVEVKAVGELTKAHEAQLHNYLKASRHRLGLLLNFGAASVQISRKVNGL